MKRSTIATALTGLALLCISTTAVSGGPMDRLSQRLELSDEQTALIATLFEEHREYVQAIEWRDAQGQPDPEALDELRTAREALNQEILAVLDAEQAAVFEDITDRRPRHPRMQPGGRAAHVLRQLDLSEAQKQAVQTLMAERRAERMLELDRFREDLASILTDDQLAQLDAMREARRAHRGR